MGKINWKYSEHDNYFREYCRKWAREHKDRIAFYSLQRKLMVLIHYGGNPPKCACCGEYHIEFLTIDHTNGGGEEHRRQIAQSMNLESRRCSGSHIISWIIKNNFPCGFQILCSNCNTAKGRNKVRFCPVHHPELYNNNNNKP